MAQTVYNIDVGVSEFFEFETGGHTYKFRHLNTREMAEFRQLFKKAQESKDGLADIEQEAVDFLLQFITSGDVSAPAFSEVWDTMITPRRNNFINLVIDQFGGSKK